MSYWVRRILSSIVIGLFAFASPALANETIASATATANCSGFQLTVTADNLLNCFGYNIDFTFTLTPASGPATLAPGMFTFTSSPSAMGCTANGTPTVSDTVNIPGSWPGGPLTGNFTVTGTDSIMPNTPGGATTPGPDITFGGSSSLTLTCAPTGVACPATLGFWKHHAFPSTVVLAGGLTIGGVLYSPSELLTILNATGSGNAVAILGKQLVAALLNLAAGGVHNPVADAAIANAESLLLSNNLNLLTSSVKPSSTLGGQLTADASVLDNYNSANFNTCSEGSGLMTGSK
jgi:hypothetical protein